MAPLVRRTWAPVGETPVLYQRTRAYERVSMIAALTVSPKRHHVQLIFTLLPKKNVNTQNLMPFVQELRRRFRKLVIVWDNLNVHRAVATQFQGKRRFSVEFLPPYAPELNPAEMLWAWLKMNPLVNTPDYDVMALRDRAQTHASHASEDQDLLRSFIRATPLSSCLD